MNNQGFKVAVIGGGSGAYATVAHLVSNNYDVYWWMRNKTKIKELNQNKQIEVTGKNSGVYKINLVTNKIKEVIEKSELIFIVLPANTHKEIILKIKPYLKSDKVIILHPGRTAGVIAVYEMLKQSFPKIIISETQSLIFTCRLNNMKSVHILKVKEFGEISFINKKLLKPEHLAFFKHNFPQINIVNSFFITSLNNMGAMLHPAPVIFNIGRIEDSKLDFKYYYEGITETISNFISEMDKERMLIAKKLGIKTLSLIDWHYQVYGIKGENLRTTLMLNKEYASLLGPKTLNHRYIYEDITTGLVPMLAIAKKLNIKTPKIKIIIDLAKMLFNYDFIENGRNEEKLNLNNYIDNQGIIYEQ